jgi:chromosome partitioning protein
VSELNDDTPAAREIAALADAIDGLGIGRATR